MMVPSGKSGLRGEIVADVGTGLHGTKWTDELLDDLRYAGDPEADDVVGRYFEVTGQHPATVFRDMLPPGAPGRAKAGVVEEYYGQTAPLPDWHDKELLRAGARFFAEHGLEIGLGLFCYALPIGYAALPAAHVLDLTSELETNAKRRVFETAQMVLDVTAPGALEPGETGHRTARHVRLMHAAIRHLVLNDPRVARSRRPLPDGFHYWRDDWGVPISQEHELGALVAFGYSMLGILDLLDVEYDESDAEAYLHLWSVIGHLLGIRADLLPIDRASAAVLEPILRRRDLGASAAGQKLTSALLDLLAQCGPDVVLHSLPAATMREMLGDDVADMLGVPDAGITEHLVEGLRPMFAILSAASGSNEVMSAVARRFSRSVMECYVAAAREHGRPSFAIPEHLCTAWDLPLPSAG